MFKFGHTFLSKRLHLVCEFSRLSWCECFSKLHHNFCLWLFNDKIGIKQRKQDVYHRYFAIPFKLSLPIPFDMASFLFVDKTTKCLVNPIYKFWVRVANLQASPICPRYNGRPFIGFPLNIHGSLAVNNACEIC